MLDGVALIRHTLAEPPRRERVPSIREHLIAGLVHGGDPSWRLELAVATAERPDLEHRFLAAAGWTMNVQGRSTEAVPLLRKAWESVRDPSSDTATELLTKLAIVSRNQVDGDEALRGGARCRRGRSRGCRPSGDTGAPGATRLHAVAW